MTSSEFTESLQPHERNIKLMSSACAAPGDCSRDSKKSSAVDCSAADGFITASISEEVSNCVNDKFCNCTKKGVICSNFSVLRDLYGIIRVFPNLRFSSSLRHCLRCFGACGLGDASFLSRGGALYLRCCYRFRLALRFRTTEIFFFVCFIAIIFMLCVVWFGFLKCIFLCITVLSFPFAFARVTRYCPMKSVPNTTINGSRVTWSKDFRRFLLPLRPTRSRRVDRTF